MLRAVKGDGLVGAVQSLLGFSGSAIGAAQLCTPLRQCISGEHFVTVLEAWRSD